MGISVEAYRRFETVAKRYGMPRPTEAQIDGWRAGRDARLAAGGPYDVLVTGRDGCAGHILEATMPLLEEITRRRINFVPLPIGGEAVDQAGIVDPARFPDYRFPTVTWNAALSMDGILFGAVGSRWDDPEQHPEIVSALRPQNALMTIRQCFDLFANVRPSKIWEPLRHFVALRPDLVEGVSEVVVVRENASGLYAGQPKGFRQRDGSIARFPMTDEAVDTMNYKKWEIERVVRFAFELARARRTGLTSVDKGNALDNGALWRRVAKEVHSDYADVPLNHVYFDVLLMNAMRKLREYHVLVMENFMGDAVGDQLAGAFAGLGMAPSGVYGDGTFTNYFEPVHGSAIKRYPASGLLEDSIANPLATILSAVMMLRYLRMEKEADALEKGVEMTLAQGYRTYDIFSDQLGETKVGTVGMVAQVRRNTLEVLAAA